MALTFTGGARLTWLGHSTFQLVTARHKIILLDPFLTENPACPPERKKVEHVDQILVTHGHGDHTGDLVALAKEHHASVVAMGELLEWLYGQGIAEEKLVALNFGGSVTLDGTTITMVRADHSSSIPNDEGLPIFVGPAAGYVIQLENGPTLYYAGDTDVFSDMQLIRELYAPDIALLPIGDRYTMGPRGAALATRLLGVKQVIPMHYGTTPILTGTPQAFRDALRASDQNDVEVIEMEV